MILTGPEILKQIETTGNITITPFDKGLINPASIDLRLGDQVAVYEDWVETFYPGYGKASRDAPGDGRFYRALGNVLNTKREPQVKVFTIDPVAGWILNPGIGYLMHTLESVWTDRYVPVLDGKSSIGRLFITVHVTAGYGDPNFKGQYTLEVSVTHPIRVYPGMRIAQMRFHTMTGDYLPYDGNYTGTDAQGPVASKAWKQFLKAT